MKFFEAYQLAAELHRFRTDQAGEPYILHLVRVAARVADTGASDDQLAAALLHDAIEDGCATPAQLLERGVPAAVVDLVQVLSKDPGEGYFDEYLARVAKDPQASVIKAADIADNIDPDRLAALDPYQAARLHRKYTRAAQVLFHTTLTEEGAAA